MLSLIITPKFNKNNTLDISIKNISKKKHNDLKICFSLIYSIEKLTGGIFSKKVGRYYEINLNKKDILPNKHHLLKMKLQTSRIKTYNLSCGPNGLFVLDNSNKLINSFCKKIKFEKKIPIKKYSKINIRSRISIIPQPKKLKFSKKYIYIKNNFIIKDASLKKIHQIFRKICNSLKIKLNSKNGIPIYLKEKKLSKENYEINIKKDGIYIFTKNYGGRIYAYITLLHLIYNSKKIPIGLIKDGPNFSWRGMHLDCARQFYSIDEIKKLLVYMAFFKLNRFHWHLTDNEAWRIYIKSFPKLAKESSYRGYKKAIPPFYGSGYNSYGGFYSIKDIKTIIMYAKKLNIEIMPEIDLPSHSWSLIKIFPKLVDDNLANKKIYDVAKYYNNTINPTLEYTWNFLKKVFKDISLLFPFKIIHVGMDERPSNSWNNSASVKKYMKKNKLKFYEDVQNIYLIKLIKTLKKLKKDTAAWNEAMVKKNKNNLKNTSKKYIQRNCIIFAWQNNSIAKKALINNHNVVLCPGSKTYFDMAYNNSTFERGLCWAGTIETKDLYKWNPYEGINKKYYDNILGIQGQLWSETITNKKYLDKMINPRLAVLSEIAWSGNKKIRWESYRSILKSSMNMIMNLGWKYHKF